MCSVVSTLSAVHTSSFICQTFHNILVTSVNVCSEQWRFIGFIWSVQPISVHIDSCTNFRIRQQITKLVSRMLTPFNLCINAPTASTSHYSFAVITGYFLSCKILYNVLVFFFLSCKFKLSHLENWVRSHQLLPVDSNLISQHDWPYYQSREFPIVQLTMMRSWVSLLATPVTLCKYALSLSPVIFASAPAIFGEFCLFYNEQVRTFPLQFYCEVHMTWHTNLAEKSTPQFFGRRLYKLCQFLVCYSDLLSSELNFNTS